MNGSAVNPYNGVYAMHIQKDKKMAGNITFRLKEDDELMLNKLAKTLNVTKTDIICSAIRQKYEETFLDKAVLRLSEEDFRAVEDLLNSEVTEEERQGRERLERVAKEWGFQ